MFGWFNREKRNRTADHVIAQLRQENQLLLEENYRMSCWIDAMYVRAQKVSLVLLSCPEYKQAMAEFNRLMDIALVDPAVAKSRLRREQE